MRVYEQSVCIGTKWPIRQVVISAFSSIKQLGVFLLPHECNASPLQSFPPGLICRCPFIYSGRERHCESTGSYPRTHYNIPGQVSNPGPLDLEASILTMRPPCLYTYSHLLLIPVFFFFRRKAFAVYMHPFSPKTPSNAILYVIRVVAQIVFFFTFQCLGRKFVHVSADMSYGGHVLLLYQQTFAWHHFSFSIWWHLLCSNIRPCSNVLLGSICFT